MVLLTGVISFMAAWLPCPGGRAAQRPRTWPGWTRTTTGHGEDEHHQALLVRWFQLHDPTTPHDRHDEHLRRPRHVPLLRLLEDNAAILPHQRIEQAHAQEYAAINCCPPGGWFMLLAVRRYPPLPAPGRRLNEPAPGCSSARRARRRRTGLDRATILASPSRSSHGASSSASPSIPMFFHTWYDATSSHPCPSSWPASGSSHRRVRWTTRYYNASAANGIAVFGGINIISGLRRAGPEKDFEVRGLLLVAHELTLLGMAINAMAMSGAVLEHVHHQHHRPGTLPHRRHDVRPRPPPRHRALRRHCQDARYSGIAGIAFFASLGLPGWPASSPVGGVGKVPVYLASP